MGRWRGIYSVQFFHLLCSVIVFCVLHSLFMKKDLWEYTSIARMRREGERGAKEWMHWMASKCNAIQFISNGNHLFFGLNTCDIYDYYFTSVFLLYYASPFVFSVSFFSYCFLRLLTLCAFISRHHLVWFFQTFEWWLLACSHMFLYIIRQSKKL